MVTTVTNIMVTAVRLRLRQLDGRCMATTMIGLHFALGRLRRMTTSAFLLLVLVTMIVMVMLVIAMAVGMMIFHVSAPPSCTAEPCDFVVGSLQLAHRGKVKRLV